MLLTLLAGGSLLFHATSASPAETKPLHALLIAGGCCHDYARQKDILKNGLEARVNVQIEIIYSPDTSTKARFELYEKPDWAKGFDVIIHDECSSDVIEMPYVKNILDPHRDGLPAVNLHCAMHCYRTGTEDWFKFTGIQSNAHGPQEPIAIHFLDREHAITRGLSDWTTVKEELYNNLKVFPAAHPLARGRQLVRQSDGTEKTVDYVVAWANEYGKARVFSTTLGHNNTTVSDPRYLDLVARGLLWACAKLAPDGHPQPGYGRRTPPGI